MQRPAFSQSPNRVGSGPSLPPNSGGSRGGVGGSGKDGGAAGSAAAGAGVETGCLAWEDFIVIFNPQVCQIGSLITTVRVPQVRASSIRLALQ
jgi:hypothetical protein